MAEFKVTFLRTLGFEDDPKNPGVVTDEPHGGKARLGVNSLAHPEVPASFWTCSYEDALWIAEKIFRHDYWDALALDHVHSQDVANKIYDMAVNMGAGTAARMVQKEVGVKVDGRIGGFTLATVNSVESDVLLVKLRVASKEHYDSLAANNPEFEKWLPAWERRAAR